MDDGTAFERSKQTHVVALITEVNRLAAECSRLTAAYAEVLECQCHLMRRDIEQVERIKVLEMANEMLETRLSRARALLEEEVAIAAADKEVNDDSQT